MHAPFVFSSIQPYPPVAIASFFKFRICVGRCPYPTLLWSVPHFSHCYQPSPLQAHWGRWCYSCLPRPACLFTARVGNASPQVSSGACHALATVGSISLSNTGGDGTTLAFSGWLVYLQFTWGSALPPLSRSQGILPSLVRAFFFSAACLLFNLHFSLFSPQWGSVCPGA
jgi:hypothetical protein